MAEHQIPLPLDVPFSPASAAPPELRDEIAAAWGLPLGERVSVAFRQGQLDTLTGTLELLRPPDFPWDPRQPLQLHIAGYRFTSREIASWIKP
jgi:hypothetical protein